MRIGIVGNGYFGTKIFDTLKNSHEVVFFTGRELNIRYDIDWVVVASSTDSHYDIVKDFLNHNVNVFCEKPLASDIFKTLELLDMAKSRGLRLYVDDVFLYNQEYIKHKSRLVNSDTLWFSWNKQGTFKDTIANNLTYHDIYILLDMFGWQPISKFETLMNRVNEKEHCFRFGDVNVRLSYNRVSYIKEKTIVYNDGECDLSLSVGSPLSCMLESVFSESVNFIENNERVRETSGIINRFFRTKPRVAVVGAGIFGISAATALNKDFDVVVYESNSDVLTNASSINQYRIHRGYHYPRSDETMLITKNGNGSFLDTYKCASDKTVKNYYCISKHNSKTSPVGYIEFLRKSNLEFKETSLELLKSGSTDLVVSVNEKLFDPVKLKESVHEKIMSEDIEILYNQEFKHHMIDYFEYVINCTYANINGILSDTEQMECQFELCEKPVVQLPIEYKGVSLVIMDGPFMCLDPYGSTDYHVLGNVVHAIHSSNVGKFPIIDEKYAPLLNRGVVPADELIGVTKIDKFIESANVFLKGFSNLKHIGSMFTVRTVLPKRDHDDARPTFIKQHNSKVFSVFSGKITTCVESAMELKEILLNK